MTPDEARTVAEKAVRDTLIKLGFDPDEPAEAQRDMAFLRSWRQSTETVKRQGLIVSVTTIVLGLLGLVWMALKGGSP